MSEKLSVHSSTHSVCTHLLTECVLIYSLSVHSSTHSMCAHLVTEYTLIDLVHTHYLMSTHSVTR